MSWATLETLQLCHDPHIMENASVDTGLSLRCLLSFAEHCVILKELGLFMNATKWHHAAEIPPVPCWFNHLQRLHMGVSHISNPNVIARFLCEGSPRPLAIFIDSCWESTAVREAAPACQPRRDMWQQVANFHRDLVAVRLIKRRRGQERRAMEAEMAVLRENERSLNVKLQCIVMLVIRHLMDNMSLSNLFSTH